MINFPDPLHRLLSLSAALEAEMGCVRVGSQREASANHNCLVKTTEFVLKLIQERHYKEILRKFIILEKEIVK